MKKIECELHELLFTDIEHNYTSKSTLDPRQVAFGGLTKVYLLLIITCTKDKDLTINFH